MEPCTVSVTHASTRITWTIRPVVFLPLAHRQGVQPAHTTSPPTPRTELQLSLLVQGCSPPLPAPARPVPVPRTERSAAWRPRRGTSWPRQSATRLYEATFLARASKIMAPTSCFTGQVHRLPDAPKAYGAMITRAKAAPPQSRSADFVATSRSTEA
jgi:hypothetical protein